MIFRSEAVAAHWDTWGYFHEGTYYLYYLIDGETLCAWAGFGVATSRDGVHWLDHGWALGPSDKMVRYFGSGAVWKDPAFEKSGRFICNYSEYRLNDDGSQTDTMLFAWSTDLIHWEKYGDDHLIRVDERYYEKTGRWEGIYATPRPKGGYFGIWTATPRGDSGNGVGVGLTDDGLNWTSLPAPRIEPASTTFEAGGLEVIGGKFYAMLMLSDPNAKFLESAQMGCYIADCVEGPYVLSAKNGFLLSQGGSFFARFFPTPGGLLVCHHSINGARSGLNPVTYVSPLKKAVVDREGTMRWLYWEGNETMKGQKAALRPSRRSEKIPMLCGPFDFQRGIVSEGLIDVPQGASASLSGIYVEADGAGFLMRPNSSGVVEVGTIDADGKSWSLRKSIDRSHPWGPSARFRLLTRRGMLELYLDDHFIECLNMRCPDAKEVSVGILGSNNSDLSVWQMSL